MKNKIYSKIKSNIFRPNWTTIETRDKKKLWLDKNENTDENLSRYIKKIFKKLSISTFNSYPSLGKIYLNLAKFLKVSPKNIFISNGSDGAIKSVFETFIKKNDLIIRTDPTYAMYSIYSKIFSCKEKILHYDKNFKINIELLLNYIRNSNPKLICIPNPDSPTGQVIESRTLEKIIKLTNKFKIFLLIDEAYFEYYKKTYIKKVNKYKNLIITRTAGKAYGISGARIGYAIADKSIIKAMHSTKPMYETNYIGVELFNQLILKKNNIYINKIVSEHIKAKKFFENSLKKKYEVLNTYGNFVLVNFGKDKKNILKRISMICYYRHFDNGILKGYTRFSLTNKKNFKKILKKIF